MTEETKIAPTEAIIALSKAGIRYEKAWRDLRKFHNDYMDAIEKVASSPEVNKAGVFNIHTADVRKRAAFAQIRAEEGHGLICENHIQFNEIADDMNIDMDALVTTFDGGR